MTESIELTPDVANDWANDLKGPVALHLRQKLVPVEGEGSVLFPPTYAFGDAKTVPYQIDELSDGTKVAQIDSVGAQANRMEPIFKQWGDGKPTNPLAALVPQITIGLGNGRAVSILDAGHRLGDALVRASELREAAQQAFANWRNSGDATEIAKLAPTSLVFGAWDSRGEGAKIPRIVQSVIRAWDVEPLTRSAQYNPPVDYDALEVFTPEEREKQEGNPKSPLAQKGFVHVPAVGTHGGVLARAGVFRDVTVNLVALRQIDGASNGSALRRYILGLSLVAAAEPLDGFLRQGCLLTLDPSDNPSWTQVERSGRRTPVIGLTKEAAFSYASASAEAFVVGESATYQFVRDRAKADLKDDGGKAKKAKK
jgi:CRISPR-associated protein Csb1